MSQGSRIEDEKEKKRGVTTLLIKEVPKGPICIKRALSGKRIVLEIFFISWKEEDISSTLKDSTTNFRDHQILVHTFSYTGTYHLPLPIAYLYL